MKLFLGKGKSDVPATRQRRQSRKSEITKDEKGNVIKITLTGKIAANGLQVAKIARLTIKERIKLDDDIMSGRYEIATRKENRSKKCN